MCKRLYFLISFILLLGLVSNFSVVSAVEPVHRYCFIDGDTGAVDYAGGMNGTLVGDAYISNGHLICDGVDDWADLPANKITLSKFTALTFELWSTQDTVDQGYSMTVAFGDTWPPPVGTGKDYIFIATSRGDNVSRGAIAITPDSDSPWGDETGVSFGPENNDNMQHQYVLTVTNTAIRYYTDGVLRGGGTNTDKLSGLADVVGYLGKGVYALDNEWRGSINEFRIYDKVLTLAEVQASFNAGPDPEKAFNPIPSYGETISVPDVTLRWKPGAYAKKHDVYFGTDLKTVHNANRSNQLGVLASQDREPNNYPVSGLVRGMTYYWRIDEVNGVNISQGNIWRFLVKPTKAWDPIPDDGEIYVSTDPTLSWNSGANSTKSKVYFGTNESTLTLETTITHTVGVERYSYAKTGLNNNQVYYWRVDQVQSTGPDVTGDLWSFKTNPFIPKTDPNLVGWWKFDEGEGTVAVDSSGNYYHGTIIDAKWVAGYDGDALNFNGVDASEFVDLPIDSVIPSLNSCTIMTWVDFANVGYGNQRIFDFGSGETVYMDLSPRIGISTTANRPMRFAINSGGGESIMDAPSTLASGWHHVAVVINATLQMQLYLDGAVVGSGSTTALPSDLGTTTNNWLGRSQFGSDGYFCGSLDDFRIYNKALTQQEIDQVMRVNPLRAWKPRPANGSTTDIENFSSISWSAGDEAAQHDVYLGTDPNAVANADTSSTDIYRIQQASTTYTPTEVLQQGQTYYWRIDEIKTDATVTPGRLWSFTIAEYLIVDDFENYDANCLRIYYTWRDKYNFSANPDCNVTADTGNETGATVGNNSAPWVEQTITHESEQSMPVYYDNSGAGGKKLYSETTRTFKTPQDWTRKGVRSLTLWFYGNGTNITEPFYVKVKDNTNTAKVNYPDPTELLEAKWHEWNIDLSKLGINLASVTMMAIGLGDETNTTTPGGSGVVYIDNIRLHPPRCLASVVNPDADFDGDCVVDLSDIETMGEQWLDSGLLVTPIAPGNTNLVGWWKFNDGSGITALDSSVSAKDGLVANGAQWVAGQEGGALWFDGIDDYVDLPVGPLISTLTKSTFSIWANFSNAGGSWQRLFDFGMDEIIYMFLTPRMGTTDAMRFAITSGGNTEPNEQRVTAPSTLSSGWHHVAVTIGDPNTAGYRTIRLYLDGAQAGVNTQATNSPSILGVTTNNWLGRSQFAADAYYVGRLDDFRIYNRALSAGEVAWIAGRTGPFSEPYDLNVNGAVNFEDFAMLAQDWLEKILWP